MFFNRLPHTNHNTQWIQIWKAIQRIEKSRKLKLDTDTWDRVYDYLECAMLEDAHPDHVYEYVVHRLYELEYERKLDEEYRKNRARLAKLKEVHNEGVKAHQDAIQAQSYTKPECPYKAKYLIEAWESGYSEASRKHSHSSLMETPETHTITRFVI